MASSDAAAQAALSDLGKCGYEEAHSPGYATGINVVIQHGYMDWACSYSRFSEYEGTGIRAGRVDQAIYDNFYFDQKIVTTLDSHAAYDDQATQLISRLDAHRSPGSSFLMVGFSNGGIVSRRVGQHRPDLVRGVISVSTPHRGVPVMKTARTAVGALLRNALVGLDVSCQIRRHDGCNQRDRMLGIFSGPSPYGVDDLSPVSGQMVPNSAFQGYLNSQPENFRRVGIQQHTRQKWQSYRVIADLSCPGPELNCGGRKTVRSVDRVYKGLVGTSILSGIVSFVFPPVAIITGPVAYATGAAAAVIYGVDKAWDMVTSGWQGSDGVVPNSSQSYPGAEHQEVVRDADSHDAAKKSDKAIDAVGRSLRRLHAPPTPNSKYP